MTLPPILANVHKYPVFFLKSSLSQMMIKSSNQRSFMLVLDYYICIILVNEILNPIIMFQTYMQEILCKMSS